MDEKEKKSKKNAGSLKDFLTKPVIKSDSRTFQYSGLGITLVITILVFFAIGRWIDGKLETGVVFTLVFTFIGFAAGFYSFYLSIKKLTEEDKKENPKYNKY